MKLFVTRHGETDWNLKHIICGTSEADLTEKGIAQAQALAQKLRDEQDVNQIRHILVSPLRRALATAEPISKALGLEIEIREQLHEVSFGIFEGAAWEDPAYNIAKYEPFYRFPGGESIVLAAQRLYNEIDAVKEQYEENVLFVCHGTAMRIIDTYFTNYTLEEYRKYHPANCELKEYLLK